MKNLFSQFSLFGDKSKKTESYIEVMDILTTLRDTNADVTVNFEGAEQAFTSYLTALNTRHEVMVIDASSNSVPTSLLTSGRDIMLSTNTHGREICFKSKFIEPFVPDLSLGHLIEMPRFLGTEQPRGAFRVLLDELRHHVAITLMDERDHQVDGVVKNISRSGVGLKTWTELPGELTQNSRTVNCRIALQDSAEISCKMEIRNIQNQQESGDCGTYVGGRMFDISRKDSNVLTDFIFSLQQQRLQTLASA